MNYSLPEHCSSATDSSLRRVVVVDDEQDILDIVRFNLEAIGIEVAVATTGYAAIDLILESRPQVVILDLMLPDISGFEICRRLRSSTHCKDTPVLILSACEREMERIHGFETGIDDYVTKPFSVRELILRVEALHRRSKNKVSFGQDADIQFGQLKIDTRAHRVWIANQEIMLTSLELKLLITLHDRKNRVQTRNSLLEHVWGMQAHISTRTVDAHIKRLREKLGLVRDYIETVRGVGYRFRESPELSH